MVAEALAAATLVRSEALPLAIPFLAYLVTRFRGWRTLAAGLATGAAFAIPVLGYASWFQREHSAFELTRQQWGLPLRPGRPVRRLRQDKATRRRTPPLPAGTGQQAPAFPVLHMAQQFADRRVARRAVREFGEPARTDFALRAIRAQPLDYLAAVWHDIWQAFLPGPDTNPYRSNYVFKVTMEPTPSAGGYYDRKIRAYDIGDPYPHLVEPYGGWIRAYQRFTGVPGPLLGLITLTGGAAPHKSRRCARLT